MSFTYTQLKKNGSRKNGIEPSVSSGKESSFPNSTQVAELGHQVDMPVVMREKMEGAFGMDLSAVKLYENRAVGEAGAEAVAKGSNIAFAPGRLDFSSTRGQALLGHEISHVASQARGEVRGSGLVNDSALEARADREGLMAARGESIATAPLSNASAASAAGPMQAKSGKRREEQPQNALDNNIQLLNYGQRRRGALGTMFDWFRTTGSHWFAPSNDLKRSRMEREKEEMASMNESDIAAAMEDKDIDTNHENQKREAKKARLSKLKEKWGATDEDIEKFLDEEEYGKAYD